MIPTIDARNDRPKAGNRGQTVQTAIERTIRQYQKSCRQKQPASKKTSVYPRPAGNSHGASPNHSAEEFPLPSPRFFLRQVRKSRRYPDSRRELPHKRGKVAKSGNGVRHQYLKYPHRGGAAVEKG